MDAFRSVRGRDADIGPLRKRRGLDRPAPDRVDQAEAHTVGQPQASRPTGGQ
jgi:hypothetical protein